jgi:two-component system sensor histidine kinase KdpD
MLSRAGALRKLLPLWPAAAAIGGVVAATAAARLVHANQTPAGLLYILVVLFASAWGGLWAGVAASAVAAACFNLFLAPDDFHFTNGDNAIAVAALVTTAVLVSRLVSRGRAQAARAEARATEVEAVNALSVSLLARAHDVQSLCRAAAEALIATGARAAGVVLHGLEGDRILAWSGEEPPANVIERAAVVRGWERAITPGGPDQLDILVPLFLSGEPIGVLVCLGTSATRSAVESVAKVLTLALERERLLRERAHVEALRESEELKTALLRAVSHDLSTPLTAIGFQVGALRRKLDGNVEALDTVGELEVEASRLHRRIEDLLALGQLEAGSVVPRPEPVPPADLFRSARESLSLVRRLFNVSVDADCPEVFADPSLALEIVVNLVENADRASGAGASAIELCAESLDGKVRLGVLDRGRGLEGLEPGWTIDARDVTPRGLGLEIAQRFAAASGGSLKLEARNGGGVAAWVLLPAAVAETAEVVPA